MKKINVMAFMSLDGVMQAPGGPEEDIENGFSHGGWSFGYWDDKMGEVMGQMLFADYDLLLGRKTYDIFAAHWPYAPDEDPIGKKFNAITKYVATSDPDSLKWENSVALAGDVVADLRRLKAEDGPDLMTQGSTELIQTLINHDLVDEYRIWTFPVVLGGGKRLFKDGTKAGSLKQISQQSFETGVSFTVYRPDGAVKAGSFAMRDPSPEELDRRARMKRAEGRA